MTKKDIMVDDLAEKAYNPFMVNRALSYFQDTVLFANEMNVNHTIDKRLQFDFFINMVRKRKRFFKNGKSLFLIMTWKLLRNIMVIITKKPDKP